MWASSCCFATLSLKTLISCCVHDSAPLIHPPFPSFLQPLIGSETYIFSVAFETEETEQIQMAILAGLYY